MAVDSSIQRITRLTPLRAVLALIESRVGAVKPQNIGRRSRRCGCMLAEDVVASQLPPTPIALRDGYAGRSRRGRRCRSLCAGAVPVDSRSGSMSARRCRAATDAVAPFDAVSSRRSRRGHRRGRAGRGVLPAGGDATPRTPLRRAGETLRAIDIAVMRCRRHCRCDRSRAAHSRRLRQRADDAADRCRARHACACRDRGRMPVRRGQREVERARCRRWRMRDVDAVIAVGGTGSGGAMPPCIPWRGSAASRRTASPCRRAKPPRSALPASGRCC